jgi:hypothetical protein
MKTNLKLWLARLLIFTVTFLNLQCALAFLIEPVSYAPSFELTGAIGNAMIQSMGLLFIMWNVPYVIAIIHPVKFRVSLIEAVVMQGIGVIGETFLLLGIPGSHPVLSSSVVRFIAFDGGGLLLLLAALLLISLQNVKK